jgi:UDP-N-acetylmuramoyl-tripeptide--D-alanyl-D-alanine ligase
MFRQLIQHSLRLFSIAILKKYHPKIVAITGSVGKSSAKEAAFLVLDGAFPGKVRCNERNLNTEIGVPITIIGGEEAKNNKVLWLKNFYRALKLILSKDKNYPEILVLEMAADRPGDISYLTSFAHPDVAVVTAIGEMPVHLEFFLERDTYISEKAHLIKNLKHNGIAILNYDDLSVREFRDRIPSGRQRIYYGFQEGANVRISDFSYNIPASSNEIEKSGMEFTVEHMAESFDSKINKTLGVPPLYAVLAGVSVGVAFGISAKDSVKFIEKFASPENRLELLKGIKNSIIINDSYNSSPVACEAALELLSKFKKNRKISVLGSMRELGKNTESAHRIIGKKSAKISDMVFFVGDETVFAVEEAEKSGKKKGEDLFWFDSSEEAKTKVQQVLQENDIVLIKGSHSIKMEAVVEEIRSQ